MSCSPDRDAGISRRCCLAALVLAGSARGEELRAVRPPHNLSRDPSLGAFLKQLGRIVSSRDATALKYLMRPEFRVEFDVGKGPLAFSRYWHPEDRLSPVWEILERLLAQGGTFYSDRLFELPYTVANFPFELDRSAHVIALRANIALVAEPRSDAPVIGSASNSIIPLARPLNPPVLIPCGRFVELNHPQLGRCFVRSDDVYHPAAHRAFFEKRNGRWNWISLAAATFADPPELLRVSKRT